jgi:hypothetical protein
VALAEPTEVAMVRDDIRTRYAGEPLVVLPIDKRLMDADATARAIESEAESQRPDTVSN